MNHFKYSLANIYWPLALYVQGSMVAVVCSKGPYLGLKHSFPQLLLGALAADS